METALKEFTVYQGNKFSVKSQTVILFQSNKGLNKVLRKVAERDINSNCKDQRFQKEEAMKATFLYTISIWQVKI